MKNIIRKRRFAFLFSFLLLSLAYCSSDSNETQRVVIKTEKELPATKSTHKTDILTVNQPIISQEETTKPTKKRNSYRTFPILDVETQKFSIMPGKDTLIVGKHGTQIRIPADAHKSQSGDSLKNAIEIELKEYYDMSDIVMANLTTMSDEKLLESGGMIYISGKCDGKDVQIAAEKSISFTFPNIYQKNDMNLFYGNEDKGKNINWKIAEPPLSFFAHFESYIGGFTESIGAEFKRNSETDSVYTSYWETPFFIKGELNMTKEEAIFFLNRTKQDPLFYLYSVKENDTCLYFESKKGINANFDKQILKQLKFRKATKTWERLNCSYVFWAYPTNPYTLDTTGLPNKTIGNLLNAKCNRDGTKTYASVVSSSFQSTTMNTSFTFEGQQLGWINCDRFLNSGKELISPELKIDIKFADVKLIFPKIQSIMRAEKTGKKYRFRNIPENETVILYVTFQKNGKIHAAIIKCKSNQLETSKLNFKTFESRADLKIELSRVIENQYTQKNN